MKINNLFDMSFRKKTVVYIKGGVSETKRSIHFIIVFTYLRNNELKVFVNKKKKTVCHFISILCTLYDIRNIRAVIRRLPLNICVLSLV